MKTNRENNHVVGASPPQRVIRIVQCHTFCCTALTCARASSTSHDSGSSFLTRSMSAIASLKSPLPVCRVKTKCFILTNLSTRRGINQPVVVTEIVSGDAPLLVCALARRMKSLMLFGRSACASFKICTCVGWGGVHSVSRRHVLAYVTTSKFSTNMYGAEMQHSFQEVIVQSRIERTASPKSFTSMHTAPMFIRHAALFMSISF
jgi:hypothetical protein